MSYKHLSIAQFKQMQDQEITIIDIRDPNSFANGNIPNSQLVNNQNLEQFIATANKDVPLVVCCYHGNSSQGAAQYFYDHGFKESYSLDGGYEQYALMSL